MQKNRLAGVVTLHPLKSSQTQRSLEEPLRCEEPEDIFFIFSAEIRPHPHMANHGARNRWRQLLGKAMTSATVRVEFTLTHVRLIRTGSFRRRFSSGTGRLRRRCSLGENQRRTEDRCHEDQMLHHAPLHFDLPFQAGKRNR